MSAIERWFLTLEERGNEGSEIDRRRGNQKAWTEGNTVIPLVHGATYFSRLYEEISQLGRGSHLWFLAWRGDAGERLSGAGTELGAVLLDAIRRGVDVRGLIWRSHSDRQGYSEQENAQLEEMITGAGGEVLLDERVRRMGSHHQKVVIIWRSERLGDSVGFVGGIDLSHGRGDDERHHGDPQSIVLDHRYGPQPAWHDVQLEVHGPAVGDLAWTFRERWMDPAPLRKRVSVRQGAKRPSRTPKVASALSPVPLEPFGSGEVAVQLLRTYPAKRPPYPFAPRGERSVASAYQKALGSARSFIYVEDQYLWSAEVAGFFANALLRQPDLRLIAVVPRYPDRDGALSGPLNRVGQEQALAILRRAGGDRVAIYDLEGEGGTPIYVHGKLCVIDDVWMAVGSDNLNRRSWTHDSEAACALLDFEVDPREPLDPGGVGDMARVLPRSLRLNLWREHLGEEASDEDLLDPLVGFEVWRRSARALDAWNAGGRKGPRPLGRVRSHHPIGVSPWGKLWSKPLYRLGVDPDGRPNDLKRSNSY